MVEPKHVRKLRDALQDTPAAANALLRALRSLFRWAVEAEEAPHDPTIGVKPINFIARGSTPGLPTKSKPLNNVIRSELCLGLRWH